MAQLPNSRHNLNPASPPEIIYQARLAAPFAVLGIRIAADALIGIDLLPPESGVLAPRNRVAELVCRQLEIYFDDAGYRFEAPLQLRGTKFQQRVWQTLRGIPSGRTRSYGEIAALTNSAPRAVGQACGANPIPIIIPCHRVLAANGMGGFMHCRDGGPLLIKQWLLRHERAE